MTDFEEQYLTDYSDNALLRYIHASPPLSPSNRRIFLLSPKLVAKLVSVRRSDDEVAGIRFAHQQVGVRVPEIKRVVQDPDRVVVYLVMDRVHGTDLEESWSQIGWLATIRIAFQLRGFVQSMRQRTSLVAGGLATGLCHSVWLDDAFGLPPYASPAAVTSFIVFWLQYSWELRRTYPNHETYRLHQHLIPAIPKSFVFTHQDLAPRNIMIDKQNNLWLVDWECSGWYPTYFEYVAMQNFELQTWSTMERFRWWIFCWISVGIYSRENTALDVLFFRSFGRYS
jgi:hypothetical protein